MTNKIKGEIPIVAEDGPLAGEYVMVLDFNALCELEEEFPGITNGEVAFSGFKSIRRLVHQGFAAYHPDLSEIDVGHVIQSIGLEAASTKLADAMKASFPEAATGDPKAVKGQRPKPSPGAGRGR